MTSKENMACHDDDQEQIQKCNSSSCKSVRNLLSPQSLIFLSRPVSCLYFWGHSNRVRLMGQRTFVAPCDDLGANFMAREEESESAQKRIQFVVDRNSKEVKEFREMIHSVVLGVSRYLISYYL